MVHKEKKEKGAKKEALTWCDDDQKERKRRRGGCIVGWGREDDACRAPKPVDVEFVIIFVGNKMLPIIIIITVTTQYRSMRNDDGECQKVTTISRTRFGHLYLDYSPVGPACSSNARMGGQTGRTSVAFIGDI